MTGLAQAATASFASVIEAGYLVAEAMENPPPAPVGYVFIGPVFDLITTAVYTPPVTVCIDRVSSASSDRLVHFESGNWVDITIPVGSTAIRLCGRASSLSPFAVIRPNSAPVAHAGEYAPFEATSPAGATVTLSGSGSDPDGDQVSFTWTEGSAVLGTSAQITAGLTLGVQDITLTVSDSFGAAASSAVRVTVQDTTVPSLTVPADFSVNAIGPTGAPATYQASATDVADPTPTVSCLPLSGSTFAIGTTVVQCTAVDDSNNTTGRSFNIRVLGAVEQILALIDKTLLFLDLPALRPLLRARLQEAAAGIVNNRPAAACSALNAFIAAVKQALPSALTAAEKSELIADANRIKGVIGCR